MKLKYQSMFLIYFIFLYRYILKNSGNSKEINYSLFAIIIHKGKFLKQGNYYSIVQRNKKWYICNDDVIKELNAYTQNEYIFFDKVDTNHMNRNGYLFFYRKIDSL